jgi:hypothetical protein
VALDKLRPERKRESIERRQPGMTGSASIIFPKVDWATCREIGMISDMGEVPFKVVGWKPLTTLHRSFPACQSEPDRSLVRKYFPPSE